MVTAEAGSAKESELRQRAAKANTNPDGTTKTGKAKEVSSAALDRASRSISVLDIFRALAGLALVSTIASYAVTSGESFTWGLLEPSRRPWFLNSGAIRARLRGPLKLTNDELAAYDGTNEGKPILLALNRTIYDVSSSPHVYGPGGMYSTLAAKDASRSYITTCFDPVDDLVPYFGGVEEVYVPVWLSKKPYKEELESLSKNADMFGGMSPDELIEKIRKKVGRKHIKKLQREAYEKAHESVRNQVRTWEEMFEKKNYPVVGRVVGVDEDNENKWKHLGFCEAARKLRPNMAQTLQEAMELVGKGDQLNINMKKGMAGMGGKSKGKGKKKGKKASEDGGAASGDSEEGSPWMGDSDHGNNDKANVRIEDMMPGGSYYDKSGNGMPNKAKKRPGIVEEKVRQNLEHGDEANAKEDIEQLKQDKGGEEPQIPDAVPDAVLGDHAKREL